MAHDVRGEGAFADDGGVGTASAGGGVDASQTATIDAGVPAACTAPGIYVVTSPGESGPYALSVFDPTTLGVEPVGSIVVPAFCSGSGIESMAVTHTGQMTVTCSGFLLPLNAELATTSPIYEWPRMNSAASSDSLYPAPWGFVELAALGFVDGGKVFVGFGPPIGWAKVDFDASSPLGSAPFSDAGLSVLDLSGSWPDSGPFQNSGAPLATTGDGRLFALSYAYDDAGVFPAILQLDPSTGDVVGQVDVAVSWEDVSHPLAFWADDFYTFPPEPADAGAGMQTEVVLLHPGTSTRETVASVDGVVAAASSSPCAPTQ